jgi:hypothetical protein
VQKRVSKQVPRGLPLGRVTGEAQLDEVRDLLGRVGQDVVILCFKSNNYNPYAEIQTKKTRTKINHTLCSLSAMDTFFLTNPLFSLQCIVLFFTISDGEFNF